MNNNPIGLAILADRIRAWLMKTYECVEVPPAAIPEYEVPDTGNLVFLVSHEITIADEWPLTIGIAEAAERVSKTVQRFKDKISQKLKSHGIEEGDTLFVREWPIFMEDEIAFRQRKFGYYGWVELFCEEIERRDVND